MSWLYIPNVVPNLPAPKTDVFLMVGGSPLDSGQLLKAWSKKPFMKRLTGLFTEDGDAAKAVDAWIKSLDEVPIANFNAPEDDPDEVPNVAYRWDLRPGDTTVDKWISALRRACGKRRKRLCPPLPDGAWNWPTPTLTCNRTSLKNGSWLDWTKVISNKTGAGVQITLGSMAWRWTNTYRPEETHDENGKDLPLNPFFMEWLMGWPLGWGKEKFPSGNFSRWKYSMRSALRKLASQHERVSIKKSGPLPDDPAFDEKTLEAFRELDSGGGMRYATTEALFADLGI